MTAFAETIPSGAPIPSGQRDPDGGLCSFFLITADGKTIVGNSRTGLVMELVSDYRTLVQMMELVEAKGDDGIDELYTHPIHRLYANALIEEGEEDQQTVLDIFDTMLLELRRGFLIQAANQAQQMTVLALQSELIEMGSVEPLDNETLNIMLADRGEVTIDLEEWEHDWPLYLIATDYRPFDPEGPEAPKGNAVYLLDPSNETTFVESISLLGIGSMLVYDDETEAKWEESIEE